MLLTWFRCEKTLCFVCLGCPRRWEVDDDTESFKGSARRSSQRLLCLVDWVTVRRQNDNCRSTELDVAGTRKSGDPSRRRHRSEASVQRSRIQQRRSRYYHFSDWLRCD